MINDPKTDPIPAPDPATPTVAAPAPMNLAAESMSLRATVVWRLRVWVTGAAAAGWIHLAEEADLNARAFLEQLVITMRVMEAIARDVCKFRSGIRTKSKTSTTNESRL